MTRSPTLSMYAFRLFLQLLLIASIFVEQWAHYLWCLSCAGRLQKREAEQGRTVHRVSCTSTRLLGLDSGRSGIFCWDQHQLSFDKPWLTWGNFRTYCDVILLSDSLCSTRKRGWRHWRFCMQLNFYLNLPRFNCTQTSHCVLEILAMHIHVLHLAIKCLAFVEPLCIFLQMCPVGKMLAEVTNICCPCVGVL